MKLLRLLVYTALVATFYACQSAPNSNNTADNEGSNSQTPTTTAANQPLDSLAYLGQPLPGTTPQKFGTGFISLDNRYEFGCTFSANGQEAYIGVSTDSGRLIYGTQLANGAWTALEPLYPEATYDYCDPMLNNAEDRLYFISKQTLDKTGAKKDYDIWYAERQGTGWTDPIHAGPIMNSDSNDYYTSFAANGNHYYATKADSGERYNYDIYYLPFEEGQYKLPVRLPEGVINTSRYEADVCVAPDESYLIFASLRDEGLGNNDLYISFKDANGNWGQAVNMGAPINTDKREFCPFISKDGKYLFYTSNEDIYWVSTEILKSYQQ